MKKVLSALILALLFCAGCLGEETVLEEGFEEGMGGWEVGMDLPMDPETGEAVRANATLVEGLGRGGDRSLRLEIDGGQDDGTIWIQRTVDVEEGELRLRFHLHNEEASFNVRARAIAYIGPSPPLSEEEMTVLGSADEREGWGAFELSREVDEGSAWVAVGITVAWETFMSYEIDDISISLS